jgi:hydrogenase-4 component F
MLTLPLVGSLMAAAHRRYARSIGIASILVAALQFGAALEVARECLKQGVSAFGPGDFLRVDGLSAVFLLGVSGVALVSFWFGVAYLHEERRQQRLSDAQLLRYYMLSHLFVFTMLLALTANNIGVMWVAIEATTITSAFLVALHQSKSSLEASWKYILIGSVGIALAFVGTVLGYFNFVESAGHMPYALNWSVLSQVAHKLNGDVLRLCFVFIVVGYGTKAGLAPMHTWLPDAHSEAPAPISAMMSGSLLAVALYAIVRWKIVIDGRLGSAYSNRLLILIGVASVAVAALLLIRQASYKRMLAYSSVEHMGLMCVGFGLGPLGVLAALLHMLAHGAGKSMMFLLSGNILHRYGSTRISATRGVLQAMPWTGCLFLAGGMALLGMPPFGMFFSELLLFRAGLSSGRPWLVALLGLLLLSIFVFFLRDLNRLLYGAVPDGRLRAETNRSALLPLALNVTALLALGFSLPRPLSELLHQAVEIVQP